MPNKRTGPDYLDKKPKTQNNDRPKGHNTGRNS